MVILQVPSNLVKTLSKLSPKTVLMNVSIDQKGRSRCLLSIRLRRIHLLALFSARE
jgi:hypothetical protein